MLPFSFWASYHTSSNGVPEDLRFSFGHTSMKHDVTRWCWNRMDFYASGQGFDLLYLDFDTVLLQDPVPRIHLSMEEKDVDLLVSRDFGSECLNTGVIYAKANGRTVAFWERPTVLLLLQGLGGSVCRLNWLLNKRYTSEVRHSSWKMMVGRLLSFQNGRFSGVMLNFKGVTSS